MGKYHEQKSPSGQFFFNLRADNGERILQSEMYTSKEAALVGVASCKENSAHDGQYQRLSSKTEQPYFTLRAKNNEVIGSSQMYSSPGARDAGIASCKQNGPGSVTQDDTAAVAVA